MKSSRPASVAPSGVASEYGGWLLVLGAALLVAASAGASVAAATASAVTGGGWVWRWEPFLITDVVRDGPTGTWPNLSVTAFVAAAVGLIAVAVVPLTFVILVVVRRRLPGKDPARHLATTAQVYRLTGPALRKSIQRLRPASSRGAAPSDLGPRLGTLAGRRLELRSSWEDVHLLVMAPRAGKTTAYAVPAILDAPGPVLATSNKADLLTDTAGIRRRAGRLWVFDPQRVAISDQEMAWDPLAAVAAVDDARRLASHFMQEIAAGSRDGDFWSSAALGLLSSLLLAAASDQRNIADIWRWLNDSADPEPLDLLTANGLNATAAGLRGRQSGAVETREGIYETARTAAQCLESQHIVEWVTPAGHPVFDPRAFVRSHDTLYLMSKEAAGAAQPLVAALADQVLHAAIRAAEAAGGRLDPPLVCVLDEAANVCKIRDLPALYSHLGSRGISAWTILQSYRQGQGVWTDNGMDTLWSAATIKIVGSGLDDPKLAEDLSRLAGDHDVTTRTRSQGEGRTSTSTSTRRQRIIAPDQIRALPRGRALLLATATPVAMLQSCPWYDRPDAPSIAAASTAERKELARRSARL